MATWQWGIGLGLTILIAIGGVAWRLGSLRQNVQDQGRRLGRIERVLDRIDRRRRRDKGGPG